MRFLRLALGALILAAFVVPVMCAQSISDFQLGDGFVMRVDRTAVSPMLFRKGCPPDLPCPTGQICPTNPCLLWRSDDGGLWGVWPDPAVQGGKLWLPLYMTVWMESSCAWAAYAATGIDGDDRCKVNPSGGEPVFAVFNPATLEFYGLASSVGGPIRAVVPIPYIPPTKKEATWTPTAVPQTATPSPTSIAAPSRTPSSAVTVTEGPCLFGSLCPSPSPTSSFSPTPTPSATPRPTLTSTPSATAAPTIIPATSVPSPSPRPPASPTVAPAASATPMIPSPVTSSSTPTQAAGATVTATPTATGSSSDSSTGNYIGGLLLVFAAAFAAVKRWGAKAVAWVRGKLHV